jgi:thymidine kinase
MARGKVTAIVGPMFAGKTEELFRRLTRAKYANCRCLVFKHQKDDRCASEFIQTHDGRTHAAQTVSAARQIVDSVRVEELLDPDVVAIDEVQFFDPDVLDAIEDLAANSIDVIVTGLTTDFRGQPFRHVPALMAIADEICVLTAVCVRCGKDANRSQLLTEPPPDGQEKVGGKGMYEARCRDCHEPPA